MKRIIILFCSMLLILGVHQPAAAINLNINNDKVTAIYFYSPTCGPCQELKDFFAALKSRYNNFTLIEYSISDLRNKSIMDKYCREYNVPKEDEGTVPIVFIRDRYFTDEKDIIQSMDKVISEVNGTKTIEMEGKSESNDLDIENFLSYKTIAALGAGMVNGINPCSMSMLLMFMSLLIFRKSIVLKVGISYCVGKFISYMLLGTVLFRFLEKLYINNFNTIIKALMLTVLMILIIFNVNDYFAAVNERYNNIKLQLPLAFRKLNHSLIRKVSSITNAELLILISFSLGIFISLGEFLCTGQIYLTTIVTVIQMGTAFGSRALIYLLVYNIGFIIPTLVLTFIVYKGKEIFEISETIRERLHIIKIINAVVLLMFVVITLVYF